MRQLVKRECEDCRVLKTALRRCPLCKKSLCSYCKNRRHGLANPIKRKRKKICLPASTASLFYNVEDAHVFYKD